MEFQPKRALDFACGTGRILQWLRGMIPETVGVDISIPMLEVARVRCPDSAVIAGDITTDPGLIGGQFDVITAFRFFLNAQPELQSEVLRSLRTLLRPRGLLIANFHLNPGSLTGSYLRVLRRIRRITDPQPMMTPRQACNLLLANGFEPISLRCYGYLLHRRKRLLLPRLSGWFERQLADWKLFPGVASNFIVVCRPRSSV